MMLQTRRHFARMFLRVVASGLLGLTLLGAGASNIQAQPATRGAEPQSIILKATTHSGALRSGSVDITKLPFLTPGRTPSAATAPSVTLLPQTANWIAAYDTYMRAHPSALPQASGVAAPKVGANFIGG